jgi:hypothetical protein
MKVARLRALLALLLGIALGLTAAETPAWAHRQPKGGPAAAGSISIPNLTHGQMAVIAQNRAAILDLAARQIPTDPTLRRLEGFINLQFFDCLWGWVPGSVEDENSPFNECSHAYLAATRTLLLHLQTMPGDRAPVRALISRIELEMLENNASLVLCRYSDGPFNTAERIAPHWRDIPFHLPSLATFAGLTLLIAAGAYIGFRRKSAPSRIVRESGAAQAQ